MKYLTLFVAILFLSPLAKAQEVKFFESLYDIPVMNGLVEVKEDSLSYDKIQGRLAYATAIGANMHQNQVIAFYTSTLAQMGWRQIGPMSFVREHENLLISFESPAVSAHQHLEVVFALSPIQG